ncbi:MAG: hypothetical protein ABI743_01925 [bacterium]
MNMLQPDELLLEPRPWSLIDFSARLIAFLQDEHHAQTGALTILQRLTAALVACHRENIIQESAIFEHWEREHRALEHRSDALAIEWETATGALVFAASDVVAYLAAHGDPADWGTRILIAATDLRTLLNEIAAQTELNRLLISQHAEMLQFTFQAIAEAVTGSGSDESYDALGRNAGVAPAATLLDARG